MPRSRGDGGQTKALLACPALADAYRHAVAAGYAFPSHEQEPLQTVGPATFPFAPPASMRADAARTTRA